MGWLEIIPLLKRLLPLLTRVAPMLEGVIAARVSASASNEEAFQRFSGELKGDFAIAAQNHAELRRSLADHTEHLLVIADDIKQLRVADTQYAARLEEAETQIASMGKWLRAVSIITILLLLVCIFLLSAILSSRR
jgi:hypothetical protein